MKTRRFYSDVAALLGTGPFVSLWKVFKYFQLFKMFRVFKVKDIIAQSNAPKEWKAIMNLCKIFFYLVMYLHIVGCYWYLMISYNGPTSYYRRVDEGNIFKSEDGQIFNETLPDNTTRPFVSTEYEAMFGPFQKFDKDDWTRKNSTIVHNADVWNKNWEKKSSQWYTPTEWSNIDDAEIFTKELSKTERYFVMLYYAVIFLGVGEIGPINVPELGFCIVFLPISLMLQSLIFSDIAVLVQTFFKKRSEQQADIDKAYEVMTWIELEEVSQNEIRQYFTSTSSTKEFQEQFDQLLQKLPTSLRKLVSKNLVEENLYANPVIRKFLRKYHNKSERADFDARMRSTKNWLISGAKTFKSQICNTTFHEKFIHICAN